MLIPVGSSGPPNARVVAVGEAPGGGEEAEQRPFVGVSGQELTRCLQEAGIARGDIGLKNVCRYRPPSNKIEEFIRKARKRDDPSLVPFMGRWVKPFVPEHIEELRRELTLGHPDVIIALGDTALWALTGKTGIGNWRGSILPCTLVEGPKVVAAFHPAAILRTWTDRKDLVSDLRRAANLSAGKIQKPQWNIQIRPSFEEAKHFINWTYETCNNIVCDIETRAGQLTCLGLCGVKNEAMCVPFMLSDNCSYWSPEHELELWRDLAKVLQSGKIIGHNYLYDAFYIAWLYHVYSIPRIDTMIVHHTCFPGLKAGELSDTKKTGGITNMRKSLAYCASIYCDWYRYWKQEGKGSDENLWHYNCLDCIYNFEVAEALVSVVESRGVRTQAAEQMAIFEPTLAMMLRGVPTSPEVRARMHGQVVVGIEDRLKLLSQMFGHEVDPWATRAGGQLQKLFYHDFGQKPILSKKTKKPSVDDEALAALGRREPLFIPGARAIREARSMRSFDSGVLRAKGPKDRLYCFFNPAGTGTFRDSSSKNPFGWGCSLQNLPRPGAEGKAELPPGIRPRQMLVPDPGYFLIEADMAKADLYVVVWEAKEEELKHILRTGGDFHTNTARELGVNRDMAKKFIHMIDYGAKNRTVAMALRISLQQADTYRRAWFSRHPGIANWHRETEAKLYATREISNKFGYKIRFFDRVEELLPEALAWVPQSTVAIALKHGFLNLENSALAQSADLQVLADWHDALFMQALDSSASWILPEVKRCMEVLVPYEDPLVIPVEIKISKTNQDEMKVVTP